MANRHLARSIALQSLFEWDFRGLNDNEITDAVTRNAAEFAPGLGDATFAVKLADGVLKKRTDIDMIIEKAAPEWPIQKIATVDRNVLRVGLYELLFADRKEVPAKVAINEAIELAKTFGGDTSGRFVNGVLGAVYKELGEPGKDEITQPKKKKADVPYEEMPIKKLGGAVVYARHEGELYLALVHDVFGHWTLSKGKLEEGEEVKDGTIREIKEEMGVDVLIESELAFNEYVASHPEEGKIRKQVTYFLAKGEYVSLTLGPSGGLTDAKWFPIKEIINLNFYNDILPIVTKAVQILLKA
jgi:N utilization substance protein B